jgi:hypothetical protein
VVLKAIHITRVRPVTAPCCGQVMSDVFDMGGASSWLPQGLPG